MFPIAMVVRGVTRLWTDNLAVMLHVRHPQPAIPECGYHLLLFASGMTVRQQLAVGGILNGEARCPVVVRWAACRPAATGLAPAEGPGDALGVHRAPRGRILIIALILAGSSAEGVPIRAVLSAL